MQKRFPLLLVFAVLLLPIGVSAVGLGDIALKSALDEPFSAEIRLISVTAEEAEQVSVKLAGPDQYRRTGIERSPLHTELEFDTVVGTDGVPIVRVTTRDAVREPFLNFLVEVSWPAGRLFREYTVLLDPPVLMRGAPPVSQAPAITQPAAERPSAVSAPAPTVQPATRIDGDTYGPVRSGETLWLIAERLRQGRPLTVQQVMIALQRANPDAFLRGNINGLKAGAVLRVPDLDAMAPVARDEAIAVSREQSAEWAAYREQRAVEATPTPRTAPSAAPPQPTPAAPSEAARLELVVPKDEQAESATPAAQGSQAAIRGDLAELNRQLAMANEESEARRLQNEELRGQIRQLEDQIASLQKLITLNVDELASLQQSLAGDDQARAAAMVESARSQVDDAQATASDAQAEAAQESSGSSTADALPGAALTPGMQAASGESMAAAEPPAAAEAGTSQVAVATAPAPAAEAPPPPPPPPAARPVPPPPPPAVVPDLMQMLTNPMVLGGIAAVIVVLLLLMVSRRKRATGGAPRVAEQGSTIPSAAAVTAAAAPVPAPQARAAESAADDIDDAFSSVVEPSRTDKSQAVTDDPLGEADVYLAYGRYEQAESLLRGALNSEPGRADYMLKLLEIYAANKDRPSFERQLEELHEVLEGAPGPQWDRALELARTMAPQHHLVGGGIVAGAAAAEVRAMPDAEAEDLDIDLDFEPVYGDDDADSGEQPLDITQEFDTETLNAAIEAGQAESDRPAAAARDLRFAIDAEEPPAAARTGTHLGFSIDDDDEQTDEAGTADDDLSLSFDLEGDAEPPAGAVDALADLDIDFGSDDLEAEADRRDAGESGETDFDLGEELPDLDLEGEIGSAGGAGADTDMVATKLELAQAYLEMEDYDGARGILEEVVNEGSSAQQQQARELLERCSPS